MAKEQPVKRATGQVERATRDLSEWEHARSRQADLSELDDRESDAEGEAVPTRDADSNRPGHSDSPRTARGDEEADEPERASSTAKPITVHNQD